jgi:hypothetical protein
MQGRSWKPRGQRGCRLRGEGNGKAGWGRGGVFPAAAPCAVSGAGEDDGRGRSARLKGEADRWSPRAPAASDGRAESSSRTSAAAAAAAAVRRARAGAQRGAMLLRGMGARGGARSGASEGGRGRRGTCGRRRGQGCEGGRGGGLAGSPRGWGGGGALGQRAQRVCGPAAAAGRRGAKWQGRTLRAYGRGRGKVTHARAQAGRGGRACAGARRTGRAQAQGRRRAGGAPRARGARRRAPLAALAVWAMQQCARGVGRAHHAQRPRRAGARARPRAHAGAGPRGACHGAARQSAPAVLSPRTILGATQHILIGGSAPAPPPVLPGPGTGGPTPGRAVYRRRPPHGSS